MLGSTTALHFGLCTSIPGGAAHAIKLINCSTFLYIALSLKKAASIFLILVHLLNIIGYHGLFYGWAAFNTKKIRSDLDADSYAGSEAITLRIPLTLPYPSNHDSYQRVDGVIEHEGAMYRLVKQKLYNDTLYVICLQDKVGKQINDAIQELANTMNEQPDGDKTSSGKASTIFVKDFETSKKLNLSPSFTPLRIIDFGHHTSRYSHSHSNSIDHPPSLS